MKTIHMIGNAHLDPVWLWDISDGVDTALATARSACDRLDEYPDFVFTCSTMWFHQVIEQLDVGLFERVKAYVDAGRWQLVGGMVIQPDCNLPSAESFARQLEFGQRYYREKFGQSATVGYNVDSFGHTAYLPKFLNQAGIDSYVFMRPMKNEKDLPANVFRWQSPGGEEVLAFRISDAYMSHDYQLDLTQRVGQIIEELPEDIDHAMCFYGVGDHGGGPTKKQIEWIIENKNSIDGVTLKFSHPRAFFDAIAGDKDKLPVVKGELQHHAIGCYAVERRIKDGMLAAEKSLLNARTAMKKFPQHVTSAEHQAIDKAQYDVLFNQFHDILGGTCLEKSNRQASGELLAADAATRNVFTTVTRRATREIAQPGVHKIVAFNANDFDYTGPIVHHPWLQFRVNSTIEIFDGDTPVEFQRIKAEAPLNLCKIIFCDTIPAGSMKIYTLVETRNDDSEDCFENSIFETITVNDISLNIGGAEVKVRQDKITVGDLTLQLRVFDDPTDTWSHSAINKFSADMVGDFQWDTDAREIDRGEVFNNFACLAAFDKSRVVCELSTVAGEEMLRLRLNVTWSQIRQRLGLVVEQSSEIAERIDLVSGGPLMRSADGLEYPIAGMSCLKTQTGGVSVIAPAATSASAAANSAVLTLIRSPYMAHHDPAPADNIPRAVTDQGTHYFDIYIRPQVVAEDRMFAEFTRLSNVPQAWDVTG